MARTDNLTNFLTDVANAIRDKKGTSGTISASSFDTEIASITTGTTEDLSTELTTQNNLLTAQETTIDQIFASLQNKTAGGEISLQEKTITPTTSKQEVTADSSYDGLSKVTVNAIPTTTQATPSISVSSSGLITASSTQSAGYVSAGTKSATKQLTTKGATTWTPKTTNQTISSGTYLTGTQTIKGDSNLVASNIKSGVSIFGVTGTFESSGEIVPKNIFSNDYSQIGYSGSYIKNTGYTLTNVLWSDLTPYTGQSATWYVTNPIEIKSDTYYKYDGFSSGNNPACCFLGSDKTTIYDGFIYKGEGNFCTPKEAKYIVMSVAKANIETMSVKEMTEIEMKNLEMNTLLNRTIKSYSNDSLTSVGNYACHSCTSLTSVNLPKVTSLGTSAFNNCTALTSIEIPLVQSITTQTFYACNSLTSLTMPSLKTIGTQGVRACKKLARVDVGVCTSIGALSFDGCSLLDTCIVRTSSVCTLANVSAFTGTLIASGTGYIYVPDDLVASYKTATNWSTYAAQIKGLSELEG